jgi:hypothetical protein
VSGDTLVVVDLSDGSQETITTSTEAFAIGGGAFDADADLLLVPDASSDGPAVWRFTVGADAVTAAGEVTVDSVLPPRQVRLL